MDEVKRVKLVPKTEIRDSHSPYLFDEIFLIGLQLSKNSMKAKVNATQEIVNVHCIDANANVSLTTWEDEHGNRYLFNELNTEDLTNYKSYVENLIHDIAVQTYSKGVSERERKMVARDIVLYAYAVVDAMMREAETWR